jgi:hypothetical protein
MNLYAFNRDLPPEDEDATQRQEAVDAAWRALSSASAGLRNFPIFILECPTDRVWENTRNLNPGTVEPMSFREFLRQPWPRGLDTSYDAVRGILVSSPIKGEAERALALLDGLVERKTPANDGTLSDELADARAEIARLKAQLAPLLKS